MTVDEFSSTFDVLFNNVASNRAPGLDKYEKSVFLTKAEEEFVISLYNGTNPRGISFEGVEEFRRYLSPLIHEIELTPIANTSGMPIGLDGKKKTTFFTLPDGSVENKPAVWFITYESAVLDSADRPCAGIGSLQVTPVRQDEYHKLRNNPFRGANNRRALRLDLPDNMVEIISQYTVTKYYIRYLRKPQPIILEDLDDGLTVNGISEETECELPEALHQPILDLAVKMAVQAIERQ